MFAQASCGSITPAGRPVGRLAGPVRAPVAKPRQGIHASAGRGGRDTVDAERANGTRDAQGIFASVGAGLQGLLSARLPGGAAAPVSPPLSSDLWREAADTAAERIRRLAAEVSNASDSASAAVERSHDPQVREMRSKLGAIERELVKLSESALESGIGSHRSLDVLRIPALLQEAIAAAPATTEAPPAPPVVIPEPEREQERERERAPAPPAAPHWEPEPVHTPAGGWGIDSPKVKPEGTGHEILLQAFNWESHKESWWVKVAGQADWFASLGFTVVWLPPPTDSVSAEGYLPRDLYNINCNYGSEHELRSCVRTLQGAGLKVLGDVVLNHRCAHSQDEKGLWNKFGGKLAWDQRAIVSDDPNFGGRGNKSTGDFFHAAPNIDHTQDFVRRDICEWLGWLRSTVGYDGWRLDFVRGFTGDAVADYMASSQPTFAVGEYWDALAYNWEGVPDANQDAHRQRIINWLDRAKGRATAFDVTTKGILHAVFERCEYWRLRGEDGNAPGLIGAWPSRAVAFTENHDTGSTQGHWRFPHHGLEQGYAYILTHPGTPSVFYDHILDKHMENVIKRLIAVRTRNGIHCRSELIILEAARDVYVAQVDEKVLLKLGPGDAKIDKAVWARVDSGNNWEVYELC